MARYMFLVLTILTLASVCLAQDTVITYQGVVSDTYKGTQLTWTSCRVQGLNAAGKGTASIGFGLAKPNEYQANLDEVYPLVLYLHGAGARGSNISQVLNRTTARHFAWQAQASPEFGAFIVAPQVPSGQKWAETPWENGPYVQSEATYTDSMHLTVNLILYLTDSKNNVELAAVLGIDANDVDVTRLYVVGDSMGAYGTWDIVAREPELFAAAIAASGSGPKNKLEQIRQTPFWAIHGEVDSTVPNRLPTANNPDGDGSLGMLAMLDPGFNNTKSTEVVRLDDYSISEDDPNIWDSLIYTEFPSSYGHGTVAVHWTTLMSGASEWLFSHPVTEEHMPKVGPLENLEADENGMILTINRIDVNELILGVTTFPNPPKHADPNFHPDKADNFDLSNGASGDDQPYFETWFSEPVDTIFLVENNGNDSGFFQGLDRKGNDIGPRVPFTAHVDYLKTDYRFFLGQRASGIMYQPPFPVYALRIIKPDEGNLGFDAISVSGIPAPPKVMPMTSLQSDESGMILTINDIVVDNLVLGVTVFPNPPKHADPNFHADKADNFNLSNGASGDDQPYIETLFGVPVTTIFMVENNGNDSGYFQALDQNGNDIGPTAPFTAHVDYLKTDYRFFLNQRASGIVFQPLYPVYGLRIIKPDSGPLGFDAISVSGIPVPPKVMPMEDIQADVNGTILTINGMEVHNLILGVTTFPNPPKYENSDFHADKADNFNLNNGASGDDQPYFETFFGAPVATIFLIENSGDDSGYFQAVDEGGNGIVPRVPFTAHADYLKTDYRFFLRQQASGIVFQPPHPVFGLRIIKPDDGPLGFDALSVSGLPVP